MFRVSVGGKMLLLFVSNIHLHFEVLRVLGHGYCAAVKECADLGFVVN